MSAGYEPARSTLEPAGGAGSERALLAGVACIVLVPYTTVALPYGRALVVQAALILTLVVVLLTWGLARKGWCGRVRGAPPEVLLAGALWAGVAALAGSVGLCRGNALRDVAGQGLAMGLLPLAAAAARGLAGSGGARAVALGLFGGVVAATIAQFANWAFALESPRFDPRLFMANQVAPLGPSLLALLAGAALTLALRGWPRTAAVAGLGSIGLYVLLSGTRGLWLVTPLGLVVFVLLARAWSRKLAIAGLGLGLAGATIFFGGSALARTWLEQPRTNLVPDPVRDAHQWVYPAGAELVPSGPTSAKSIRYRWNAQPGARRAAVIMPFAVDDGRVVRVRASLKADGAERSGLVVWLLDRSGRPCVQHGLLVAAAPGEQLAERVFPVPAGVTDARIVVVVEGRRGGSVELGALEVHDLGPGVLWPLYLQWQILGGRAGSLAGDPMELASSQRSVAVRLAESRRLAELSVASGWSARLLGHGLGARYPFEGSGLDAQGNRVVDRNPNYIHNFYLFLGYKTGLIGTLAILAALLTWVHCAARTAWRAESSWQRLWSAAVAAALVAYGVWGVASPEFVNFRVAPLWGCVLAGLDGGLAGRCTGTSGSGGPASSR